jgi:hypothetical protein
MATAEVESLAGATTVVATTRARIDAAIVRQARAVGGNIEPRLSRLGARDQRRDPYRPHPAHSHALSSSQPPGRSLSTP